MPLSEQQELEGAIAQAQAELDAELRHQKWDRAECSAYEVARLARRLTLITKQAKQEEPCPCTFSDRP